MVKHKKPRQSKFSKTKSSGFTFIDNIDKHYQELEKKNAHCLVSLRKYLSLLKQNICLVNVRSEYHQRNKWIRIYQRLLKKKVAIESQTWKKQFLHNIAPLLDKVSELHNRIHAHGHGQVKLKIKSESQ